MHNPAVAVNVNRNAVTFGVVEICGFGDIETGVETGGGAVSVRIIGCTLSHPRIFSSSLLPFSFIYSITFCFFRFPFLFFNTHSFLLSHLVTSFFTVIFLS
jgi:hypothetical protein